VAVVDESVEQGLGDDGVGEQRGGPYPLQWTTRLTARFVGRHGNGFDTS
jgi:hypothetical protein